MKNKLMKSLGVTIFSLAMSGCAMQQISNDMTNNVFLDQTPIENSLSGVYTATIGPFLTTYVIEQDGTGVNCYVANGSTILHRVKIYSKIGNSYSLITETGLKSTLSKLDSGSLTMKNYGSQSMLQPDQNLAMANLSCRVKLART